MTDLQPSLPPGPAAPRLVQTLAWMARPGPFMKRCRARYGDAFTMRVAHEGTWVMLSDPEAIKQVFTGSAEQLHAGEANVVLQPILGRNSVLLLDERQHMSQRKLMLPPLHGERMQGYGELMAAVADREIDRWPVGESFPLWPRMQAVTLEVIMRAVFGIEDVARLEHLGGLLGRMLDWTGGAKQLVMLAALGPHRVESLRSFRRLMDPVDSVLLDEIRRRRDVHDLEQRDDILSLLLQARHEDGSPMSDIELRDELMTLLVAGHETTATALAWGVERLVRNPSQLERLTEEVAAGEDAYLDAVTKETLRLRPVLPIVLRRLTEPLEIGGRVLPAGVSVAPCIYLIHRRPEIYPEPERFLPERFLDRPAGTYTWIPFGGGVRRCLGASFALFEMQTVLARIVARTKLRAARPEPEGIGRRVITLTPSRGAEVVVTARDRAVLAPPAPASPLPEPVGARG